VASAPVAASSSVRRSRPRCVSSSASGRSLWRMGPGGRSASFLLPRRGRDRANRVGRPQQSVSSFPSALVRGIRTRRRITPGGAITAKVGRPRRPRAPTGTCTRRREPMRRAGERGLS
jgi:hypothetical protein